MFFLLTILMQSMPSNSEVVTAFYQQIDSIEITEDHRKMMHKARPVVEARYVEEDQINYKVEHLVTANKGVKAALGVDMLFYLKPDHDWENDTRHYWQVGDYHDFVGSGFCAVMDPETLTIIAIFDPPY